MITRILETQIRKRLFSGKVIILTGPRQAGKTTLINKILEGETNVLLLDGDDPTVINLLNRPNTEMIRQLIGTNKIVFIDESQRINEIGLTSKIIVDRFKDIQLILNGSSSFELLNLTQEPLTGRKWTFTLLPVSWNEYQENAGFLKAEQDLDFIRRFSPVRRNLISF
jgi:predicted AAA+ superfamily ATPase